jgi:[acyl-carrier-protein] S-malonyltransferase
VFAGSLGFEEALEIVRWRGQYMQEACDQEAGGMISILGLAAEKVEAAVARARPFGPIGIANYKRPRPTGDLRREGAPREGGRRGQGPGVPAGDPAPGGWRVPLAAHGLRHRAPAPAPREKRRSGPRAFPSTPTWSAKRSRTPEAIRDCLIRQVESPVRWEDTMRRIAARGVDRGYEVGPGRVLAGLSRNIDCGLPRGFGRRGFPG